MSVQPRATRLPVGENEFVGWIIQTATTCGWTVKHVPFPVRPVGGGRFVPEARAKGLPDLVLVHRDPPRLVFAEVKKEDGKVSVEQRAFLDAVQTVGAATVVEARAVAGYVWRPSDADAVTEILRTRRLP